MNTSQAEWYTSLFDPAQHPSGLCSHNQSDVNQRFNVYRNNVMTSLVAAIRSSFPIVEQLVGTDFFTAMATAYVHDHQPQSPQLTFYGQFLPDFVADFPPAQCFPFLADVAQVEMAFLRSFHAADARPITTTALESWLLQPDLLANSVWTLSPSTQVLALENMGATIWQLHQDNQANPEALAALDWHQAEYGLLTRPAWQPLLETISVGDYTLIAALQQGKTFGEATAQATATDPHWDLSQCLTTLLQHHSLIAIQEAS